MNWVNIHLLPLVHLKLLKNCEDWSSLYENIYCISSCWYSLYYLSVVDFRSCTLLSCSKKGRVVLRSVELPSGDVTSNGTPLTWTVCGSGDVLCSKVDENENYALFGGWVLFLPLLIYADLLQILLLISISNSGRGSKWMCGILKSALKFGQRNQ